MSIEEKREKAKELAELLIGIPTEDAKEICKLFLPIRIEAMSVISPEVVGRL